MVDISAINEENKTVTFTDGRTITHSDFVKKFKQYFSGRIAGETLMPHDMERFMSRSSSKNLKQLVDNKKAEGFIEGSLGKSLSPRQKIAIMTIFMVVIIAMICLAVANSMGWL